MALRKLDILNRGLAYLGKPPVEDLSSTDPIVAWFEANFDTVRDAELIDGEWTFATQRLSVDENLDDWVEPAFEYERGFLLFNDPLSRPLEIDYSFAGILSEINVDTPATPEVSLFKSLPSFTGEVEMGLRRMFIGVEMGRSIGGFSGAVSATIAYQFDIFMERTFPLIGKTVGVQNTDPSIALSYEFGAVTPTIEFDYWPIGIASLPDIYQTNSVVYKWRFMVEFGGIGVTPTLVEGTFSNDDNDRVIDRVSLGLTAGRIVRLNLLGVGGGPSRIDQRLSGEDFALVITEDGTTHVATYSSESRREVIFNFMESFPPPENGSLLAIGILRILRDSLTIAKTFGPVTRTLAMEYFREYIPVTLDRSIGGISTDIEIDLETGLTFGSLPSRTYVLRMIVTIRDSAVYYRSSLFVNSGGSIDRRDPDTPTITEMTFSSGTFFSISGSSLSFAGRSIVFVFDDGAGGTTQYTGTTLAATSTVHFFNMSSRPPISVAAAGTKVVIGIY